MASKVQPPFLNCRHYTNISQLYVARGSLLAQSVFSTVLTLHRRITLPPVPEFMTLREQLAYYGNCLNC